MPNLTYPGPETIRRDVLDNGIVVLVYENFAAQSVVVEGYGQAGGLSTTRAQAGLADFTAQMLMHGTQRRSFEEIYEAMESTGTSVSCGAGRHINDFSATGLAEDLDLMLDLLAESLRRPVFPAGELEKVRGELLTGFQIQANDTRSMAGKKFREQLYGEHPYGISSSGYPETVQAFNQAGLADFHARHYGPEGMVVVVVGAVKADVAIAKIQAVFGDWHNPNFVPVPVVPDWPRPGGFHRLHHPIPDKTQADIVLGWIAPQRAVANYMDASMANTVLGVFGMMGRLGSNVREKQGLAYYAYSRLQGGLGPAPWYVSTGVAPDKVEQAIDSILHEVDRMRNEPVPLEELADSQAYRTGSMPVSLETNDGLAGIIADIELFGLGLDYLQRFPDIINGVTPEKMQAVAQTYLSTEEVTISVAGPPELG